MYILMYNIQFGLDRKSVNNKWHNQNILNFLPAVYKKYHGVYKRKLMNDDIMQKQKPF